MFQYIKTKLVIPLICFSITACSNHYKETFDLDSWDAVKNKHHMKSIQLQINEPSSTKVFDSENIIVKGQLNDISYLGSSQWCDRLPILIQDRLISSFENSHYFCAVGKGGEHINYNYSLISNIRNFNLKPLNDKFISVNISIAVKLLNESTGKVRASKIFTVEKIIANHENNYIYLNIMNVAFVELVGQIVTWTHSRIRI